MVLNTTYRDILRLALPIIFGAFVQSALLFIDSYFLSVYNVTAFSAVGNAGLLFITFFMFGNGLADAGQIFMAGRLGKDNLVSLRKGFQTNFIHLLLLSGLLFILLHIIRLFFVEEVVQSENVAREMMSFLKYRPLGYFFVFATLAITSYYVAIGRSVLMLYNTILLCGVNAFLDYAMIFGNYGFPQLGTEGAAIATVISEALVFVFSLLYLLNDRKSKKYELFKDFKRYRDEARRIIKLAAPLMFQGFLATGGWTTYFFMIEQMGEFEIQVSQIIHKLYWLALIPMFGFAAATRTFTSNLLAAGKLDRVRKTMWRIMFINYVFVILFFHGNVLYPEFWIGVVYDPEVIDPLVIENAKSILLLISGSILIHSAAMVFQSLIAGAGHTFMAFKIEAISLFIYLIVAYILIFIVKADVTTVWVTEYVYFGIFLILDYWYYRSKKWELPK